VHTLRRVYFVGFSVSWYHSSSACFISLRAASSL
jgi:hypothetical protein